ncbi:hypothetical protein K492DRAFT_178395 [Lichtheimia hyalospora FSU 10163]|nr:hypothetical protein K492DRAFT_178395 [Lichtheimia hyalospora FSU 10163]
MPTLPIHGCVSGSRVKSMSWHSNAVKLNNLFQKHSTLRIVMNSLDGPECYPRRFPDQETSSYNNDPFPLIYQRYMSQHKARCSC